MFVMDSIQMKIGEQTIEMVAREYFDKIGVENLTYDKRGINREFILSDNSYGFSMEECMIILDWANCIKFNVMAREEFTLLRRGMKGNFKRPNYDNIFRGKKFEFGKKFTTKNYLYKS